MGGCCCWLALGCNSVAWAASFSAASKMSLTELVPEKYWGGDSLVDLVFWLNNNIKVAIEKKYLLLEWCRLNGVDFTKDMASGIGLYRG